MNRKIKQDGDNKNNRNTICVCLQYKTSHKPKNKVQ